MDMFVETHRIVPFIAGFHYLCIRSQYEIILKVKNELFAIKMVNYMKYTVIPCYFVPYS